MRCARCVLRPRCARLSTRLGAAKCASASTRARSPPAHGETLVTGDAVNVAARLEQAAAPGEILIGEATERLVRDGVRVEASTPLELKGKAEAVPAFRLLEVLADAPAFARRIDAPVRRPRGRARGSSRRLRASRGATASASSARSSARRGSASRASPASSSPTLESRRGFSSDAAFRTARASPTGRSARSSVRSAGATPATRIAELVAGEEADVVADRIVGADLGSARPEARRRRSPGRCASCSRRSRGSDR